jgi:hypothetical protein
MLLPGLGIMGSLVGKKHALLDRSMPTFLRDRTSPGSGSRKSGDRRGLGESFVAEPIRSHDEAPCPSPLPECGFRAKAENEKRLPKESLKAFDGAVDEYCAALRGPRQ